MPSPSKQQLQMAFNRARLYNHGLTLDQALGNKAIAIGLKRMAEVAQKPARKHWQDIGD